MLVGGSKVRLRLKGTVSFLPSASGNLSFTIASFGKRGRIGAPNHPPHWLVVTDRDTAGPTNLPLESLSFLPLNVVASPPISVKQCGDRRIPRERDARSKRKHATKRAREVARRPSDAGCGMVGATRHVRQDGRNITAQHDGRNTSNARRQMYPNGRNTTGMGQQAQHDR